MSIISKKIKTAYFCSQCGAEHTRWQGQCRECGSWNSLIEERVPERKKARSGPTLVERKTIAEISGERMSGYRSGISEFDRVIGGQLLPGMAVLLGGEPGIGKSTLLLQVAQAYSAQGIPVLYATGEESLSQIKIRASRLSVTGENVTVINTMTLEEITETVESGNYGVVLIDSIQTVTAPQFDSPPGTIGQIRECANQLVSQAKSKGHALFLVGHVTKEGFVAGPKVLEHMVDTVVYFEGDNAHLYRMLRATKNRFGSVAEIGLFEMGPRGLEEVKNPSSLFLTSENVTHRSGSVVSGVMEGNRPLLVEVQALVTRATYSAPQRVASGIDSKKLALLLAILEKRLEMQVSAHDVFASVAGGLRIAEPSLDLAILIAIASSLQNRPVRAKTMIVGEVGLSGEVRGIAQIDRRVSEAAKLGFTTVIVPETNRAQVQEKSVEVIGVTDIQTALEISLG